MGYRDRIIHLDFSEALSGDPVADPIWVKIRNPALLPPEELASASDGNTGVSADGKVSDRQAATEATRRIIAKLVIAARVYDATILPEYDEEGEEVPGTGEPVLLPRSRWTPEVAAKLPTQITIRISQEVAEAVNPQKKAAGVT